MCPAEAVFWGNLGGAYGNKGAFEDSVSALKRGVEIAPDSLDLRKNLSATYMRMRAYDKALSTLEEIPPSKRAKSIEIETLIKSLKEKVLQAATDPHSTGQKETQKN